MVSYMSNRIETSVLKRLNVVSRDVPRIGLKGGTGLLTYIDEEGADGQ